MAVRPCVGNTSFCVASLQAVHMLFYSLARTNAAPRKVDGRAYAGSDARKVKEITIFPSVISQVASRSTNPHLSLVTLMWLVIRPISASGRQPVVVPWFLLNTSTSSRKFIRLQGVIRIQ